MRRTPSTVVHRLVEVRFVHANRPSTGGTAPAARRSKNDHRHPLAGQKNPAARSITVPDVMHRTQGSPETLSAQTKSSRVKNQLLRRYEEELLWGNEPLIEHADHWLAKHIQSLRTDPRYRYSKRMMVVAGRDVLRELHDMGFEPEHLVITQGKDIPEWTAGRASEIVRCTRDVMEVIAPGTDGYVGNFTIPDTSMVEELQANSSQMTSVLVLENVQDPGTLGSLLRTAAGMAYDAVLVTHHCADLFDHRVVSAARGVHFQSLTKFYDIRSEDGDDVYGLLNHVIERNNLQPTVFTPALGADLCDGMIKKSLHRYCMESYMDGALPSRPSSAATSDVLSPGQMLITGPDHRRSLCHRVKERINRPAVALELDSPLQFALAVPVILQSLRHTASWDYLFPVSEEESLTRGKARQLSTSKAQIGPDRLLPIPEPNMSLEEWEYANRMQRVAQREARLARYRQDDLTDWEELQMARVMTEQKASFDRKLHPYKPPPVQTRMLKRDSRFPNYIAELREEGTDRDSLREIAKWAQTYKPPPNYDKRFQPPTPVVRRGRVVPTYY